MTRLVFVLAKTVALARTVMLRENWPKEAISYASSPTALRGSRTPIVILHHSFFELPLDELNRWAAMFADRTAICIKLQEINYDS